MTTPTPQTHTTPIVRRVDPAALIPGEPFVALRVGPVYDASGEELPGNVTDRAQLLEMVAHFERSQLPSGDLPLLDFDHAAIGPMSIVAHPERSIPLGAIVAMRVEGDGLVVTPAWTKRGREIIDAGEGLLHPSATYRLGDMHDRATGERTAGAALLAVAVTPMPATRPDQLGAVRSALADQEISSAPHGAPLRAARAAGGMPMGIEELLAALQALSPEDKAKMMAALGGGEDEAAAEPTGEPAAIRAEVPVPAAAAAAATERSAVADLQAWRRKLEAERGEEQVRNAFLALVQRGAALPNEESVYRLAHQAGGPALASFTGRPDGQVYRGGVIGRPADASLPAAPPADRNGFALYVLRSAGKDEIYMDALTRIRKAFPAQSSKAFGDRGTVDDSPLQEVIR